MGDKTPHLPFKPNFTTNNTILIPKPISEVLPLFASPQGHERICRLSSLCTAFDFKERDLVEVTTGKAFHECSFLDASKVEGQDGGTVEGKVYAHRQHFTIEETVPVALGLLTTLVRLRGTFTWVEPSNSARPVYAVYESQTLGGIAIRIRRLRKIEEVDIDQGSVKTKATRISEELWGVCPWAVKWLVASEATAKHREHVSLFPKLFE